MKKLLSLILVGLLCASPLAFGQGSKSESGSLTAACTNQSTNCTTADSDLVLGSSPNFATTVVQLTGTWNGQVNFEVTIGPTWVPIIGTPITGGTTVTTAIATGTFTFATSGFRNFRVRAAYLWSGSIGVNIQASETGR